MAVVLKNPRALFVGSSQHFLVNSIGILTDPMVGLIVSTVGKRKLFGRTSYGAVGSPKRLEMLYMSHVDSCNIPRTWKCSCGATSGEML